jgi:hypothetical protein
MARRPAAPAGAAAEPAFASVRAPEPKNPCKAQPKGRDDMCQPRARSQTTAVSYAASWTGGEDPHHQWTMHKQRSPTFLPSQGTQLPAIVYAYHTHQPAHLLRCRRAES